MQVNPRYDNFAIALHWLMVLLIFGLYGLGWYMVDLPKGSDERTYFFALHKSIGLTVALLALIRLAWRTIHKPPPLPDKIPALKRHIAHFTHSFLYVLMFLQPVSGYISSSFSGFKTRFWGIALPHWGWKDQVLNELFTEIHVASSVALLCLIVLHIAGSLSHIISSERELFLRMLPSRASRSDNSS